MADERLLKMNGRRNGTLLTFQVRERTYQSLQADSQQPIANSQSCQSLQADSR